MNKQKPTVTIAIPAYNEENNIGRLLQYLSSQKESDFVIKKILVVSDASTDKTDAIVQGFNRRDSRVELLRNTHRLGQIFSQNTIFNTVTTDYVVLLEADTYPATRTYIANLLLPFMSDSSIGLIQGATRSVPSKRLIGKILEKQVHSINRFIFGKKDAADWFASGRGGRAFSRNVYDRLRWPSAVPEDIYAYVWCKKHKVSVVFQKQAVCLYKTSQTINDLTRERQKINSGRGALNAYFSDPDFAYIYKKPLGFQLKTFFYFVSRYPFHSIGYLLLKIFLTCNLSKKQFTDLWEITISTK